MTIRLHHSFRGHSDKVWETSVHKYFPLLATVSSDKTCRVYNLKTNQLLAILDEKTHKKTIRTVDWKPTKDYPSLALGSFDSTISIWGKESDSYQDYTTTFNDNEDEEWELMAIIEGHENEIKSVSWSSTGDFLATCSRDKTIWIWECDESNEEFECINVLQDHTQDVKCCKFHPEELLLGSASYDDTVRLYKQDIYDDDDWCCVSELTGHKGTVWSIDFEKKAGLGESLRLCSCSDDSSVKIWKRLRSLGSSKADSIPSSFRSEPSSEDWIFEQELPEVHERQIYSCSWSEHSGKIASCGSDGKIVIYKETDHKWQVDDVQELGHTVFEVNSCEWWYDSDAGKEYVITAGDDGVVNMWLVE